MKYIYLTLLFLFSFSSYAQDPYTLEGGIPHVGGRLEDFRINVSIGVFDALPDSIYTGPIGTVGFTGYIVDSIQQGYLLFTDTNIFKIDSVEVIVPGSIAMLWVKYLPGTVGNLMPPEMGRGMIVKPTDNLGLLLLTQNGSDFITEEQEAKALTHNFIIIDRILDNIDDTNIYTSDGTLTDMLRTLTMNNGELMFIDGTFTVKKSFSQNNNSLLRVLDDFNRHEFLVTNNAVGINTSNPLARLHMNNGSMLLSGNLGATPTFPSGNGLMWIASKGSLVGGTNVNGTWTNANIGDRAVILSLNSTGTGDGALVLSGESNTATQQFSTVIASSNSVSSNGYSAVINSMSSKALGTFSLVTGSENSFARGFSSAVIQGAGAQARANNEVIIGRFSQGYTVNPNSTIITSADRIFTLANGRSTAPGDTIRSNAIVVFRGEPNNVKMVINPGTDASIAPTHTLRVKGTLKVDSLLVSATKLAGWNNDNEITGLQLGTGLAINNDTLFVTVEEPDIVNIYNADGTIQDSVRTVTMANTRIKWQTPRAFEIGNNNVFNNQINQVAIGENNTLRGPNDFVVGSNNNTGSNPRSGIIGLDNINGGTNSLLIGRGLIDTTDNALVIGQYNQTYTSNKGAGYQPMTRLLVVGDGFSTGLRSSAFVVHQGVAPGDARVFINGNQNTLPPENTLRVGGSVRIDNRAFTPTRITGFTNDGVIGQLNVGSGLILSNDTLKVDIVFPPPPPPPDVFNIYNIDGTLTNSVRTLNMSNGSLNFNNGTFRVNEISGQTSTNLFNVNSFSGSTPFSVTNARVGVNVLNPSALFHVNDGAVVFTGATGAVPISGTGTRFMWAPAKAALRVGAVTGDKWDNANVGSASFIISSNSTASGIRSGILGGDNNNTTNTDAMILGSTNSTSTGNSSIVVGSNTSDALGTRNFIASSVGGETSENNSSLISSFNSKSSFDYSTSLSSFHGFTSNIDEVQIGRFTAFTGVPPNDISSTLPTDRLFTVSNGGIVSLDTVRSNAFVVYRGTPSSTKIRVNGGTNNTLPNETMRITGTFGVSQLDKVPNRLSGWSEFNEITQVNLGDGLDFTGDTLVITGSFGSTLNLYNGDSTLTSNRTITASNRWLQLDGGSFIVKGSLSANVFTVPTTDTPYMIYFAHKSALRVGTNGASANWSDINTGQNSVAFGLGPRASGPSSAAFGNFTIASNTNSFASGGNTLASGLRSFAANNRTTASGENSTAFGSYATASALRSFAIGDSTLASGITSIATGKNTIASGVGSFSAGINGVAADTASAVFGWRKIDPVFPTTLSSTGKGSFAMGSVDAIDKGRGINHPTIRASGEGSFAGGRVYEGSLINDIPDEAFLIYDFDTLFSITGNRAYGKSSFAYGYEAKALGNNSTAMGMFTVAYGDNSVAMGGPTWDLGDDLGMENYTGPSTSAVGGSSVAIGDNVTSVGRASFTTNSDNYTYSTYGSTFGKGNINFSYGATYVGVYAYIPDPFYNSEAQVPGNPLFVVGNGDLSEGTYSSAFIVFNGTENDARVTINPGDNPTLNTIPDNTLRVNGDVRIDVLTAPANKLAAFSSDNVITSLVLGDGFNITNDTITIGGGGGTTAASCGTIDYISSKVYGTASSPCTGTILHSLIGANLGIIQKIYHSSNNVPALPSGWILLGGNSYVPGVLNIIYAEFSGTPSGRVEYWIVQQN